MGREACTRSLKLCSELSFVLPCWLIIRSAQSDAFSNQLSIICTPTSLCEFYFYALVTVCAQKSQPMLKVLNFGVTLKSERLIFSLTRFSWFVFSSTSHWGQPPCDQHHPRERLAHLCRLHPGGYNLGSRPSTDLQSHSSSLLLLPVAFNHRGLGLPHAQQALLQQFGGHPGSRHHWDLLERCHLRAFTVGVSKRRSHG